MHAVPSHSLRPKLVFCSIKFWHPGLNLGKYEIEHCGFPTSKVEPGPPIYFILFAAIAHKAQGRTLDRSIVELAGCNGGGTFPCYGLEDNLLGVVGLALDFGAR
jgi:hypothetical protein